VIVALVIVMFVAVTAEIRGGLPTVTGTVVAVPVLPAASFACAPSVCAPFAIVVVSQVRA
jgi:hypothetical protein